MGDTELLSESATVVAVQDCLSTNIDGEAVILHTGAGKYYGFNPVGTYVWDLIQEPQTVEEVCRAVAGDFDVTYEECRTDVVELLAELSGKGLVDISER